MKLFKLFGLAGAFATAALLPAASTGETMHVKVPFAFVVAGTQFAPGDYVISENEDGVILVQGGGKGAMALSTPAGPSKAGGGSNLKFASSARQLHLVAIEEDGLTTRTLPVRAVEARNITLSPR